MTDSEQKLKIETGNTVTKLRAGEYQLELASGSDSVSIDNGSFVWQQARRLLPGFGLSQRLV